MQKKRQMPPQTPIGAEILIKESIYLDQRTGTELAQPELVILANRAGFEFLSRLFKHFADRPTKTLQDPQDPDPECHDHWFVGTPPELSDFVEWKIGWITDQNRAAVFRKYGISQETAQQGSLIERYERQVARARRAADESQIHRTDSQSS